MSLPTRRRASLKVTKRALSAAFARGLPVCPSFVDRESRAAASAPHDSHRVPQNRASARNQSRSSRDTRRYVGGTWRDTGKPEILGIARELWQRGVGDRRLAAGCRSTLLGSRTITQWDCARESAAGIRESHVFVESATYGPATSRYGGREGGRSARDGKREASRFPGCRTAALSAIATRLHCPARASTRDGITVQYSRSRRAESASNSLHRGLCVVSHPLRF